MCPSCGYVRTENAKEDRSPCPRCHGTHIADNGSCVFNVVEPTQVTSRDKREDARISDDADERSPHFHETVTAVDMAAQDIEPGSSWRHTTQVFGIDFTRYARVRRLNLGPARFDTPPRDEFAGFTVRLNPFHVCTGCGAATADGKPVFDHDADALSSSAARNPELKHHRPWCPLRRGKKADVEQLPVLLAHQLQTEAVRVLLPAATVLVEERVYSVRAALRLGVDRAFGGDPAHIDSTIAFMADQATGEQRCFLVLYDALPGGTGYLHRLTKPQEFKTVLEQARTALVECPCAGEGRRACHRCLHRYTPDSKQDIVDRREALDVIDQLLETWETAPVADTHAIGLDAQVESDLEARFLAALRAWAERTDGTVLDEEGRRSAQLRIAPTGRPSAAWRLTAQYNAGATRPDFTFQRVDGPAQTVHVYLDGLRWHASPESNRLAQDAAQRTRLRAEGHLVFQLTWDDLDLFEGRDRAEPVWPPYPGGAQDAARTVHQRTGGDPASLAEEIWTNPLNTLLDYLSEPDPDRWARRAGSAAVGLLRVPAAQGGPTPVEAVPDTVRAAISGQAPTARGASPITVAASRDDHGLPLVLAVDNSDPNNPHWTVLAVLDDSPAALASDGHKTRWRAWLYWSNLIQFLSRHGGDGVQLTLSQAAAYPVETLAVCGGVGELDSLAAPSAHHQDSKADQELAHAPASIGDAAARDDAWDTDVLPYLDQDEPALLSLAQALAEHGAPAPEAGHELGSGGYLAEMAWHRYNIAIVLAPHGEHDQEAARRDAAYTEAGWTVKTAAEWREHFDTLVHRLIPTPAESEGAAR